MSEKMIDLDKKDIFMELIEKNQDIIHKICGLYSANEEDRKDMSQEIVYQLWKSYKKFQSKAKFTTWMYKVALNTALLNLRRAKYRNRTENLNQQGEYVKEETDKQEKKEKIGGLYKAINRLREFDRALILLHLEQLSYKEIADISGISEDNVSVRLVRIKKKLKEYLSEGPQDGK